MYFPYLNVAVFTYKGYILNRYLQKFIVAGLKTKMKAGMLCLYSMLGKFQNGQGLTF